jgi:hypothetical protein
VDLEEVDMIMIIKVIEVAVVVKEVEVVPSNQEEASKIKNKLYANFLTNQEDAKKPQKIVNFYILNKRKHNNLSLNFPTLQI